MYDKRESEVISFALKNLKEKYDKEAGNIYKKTENMFAMNEQENKELEKLNKIIKEIDVIRERFDLERNTKSWYKLIKRTIKKKLLRKLTIWLSK